MAKRRYLPVKERDDPGFSGMHDDVVQAYVAVHDARGLVLDHVCVEIRPELAHPLCVLGLLENPLDGRVGCVIIAAPSLQLTGSVIANLTEVCQANSFVIDGMEGSERLTK